MASLLSEELLDILRPYVRFGAEEWRAAPDVLRRTASNLGVRIADEKDAALHALSRAGKGRPDSLIPMPRPKKIARAFFVPLVTGDEDSTRVAFEVVMMVAGSKVLAYRFEPAHPTGNHTYDHVQMSREVLGRNIALKGIPSWLPTSYPAHPLPSRDPLDLFLCMLTSMQGYRDRDGSLEVIKEMLDRANRPADALRYARRLSALLVGDN